MKKKTLCHSAMLNPNLNWNYKTLNNITEQRYFIATYNICNRQIFAPFRLTMKRCVEWMRIGLAEILKDEISPSEWQINLHRHYSFWSESINTALRNEDK
jgi:hypothetical protein